MKKLVKKSATRTVTAFKSCTCSTNACQSTSKGFGVVGTKGSKAGLSTSARYS